MERHAGPDSYDGIPYEELPIDSVDWEKRGADYIRHRSIRKGSSREFNVEPEWATEAALDEHRWASDSGSKTGESRKVVGYSPAAGRLLTVILVPKDHPPAGDWWGASAWAAKSVDQREYEKYKSEGRER